MQIRTEECVSDGVFLLVPTELKNQGTSAGTSESLRELQVRSAINCLSSTSSSLSVSQKILDVLILLVDISRTAYWPVYLVLSSKMRHRSSFLNTDPATCPGMPSRLVCIQLEQSARCTMS